ncbi:MAG: DUF6544 family protein [Microthrixaceae bacterium]
MAQPDPDVTWAKLAEEPVDSASRFNPDSLEGLPEPARRFLTRAVPNGVALFPRVELRMVGRIKLGRKWKSFTAEQILRAGVGFVWRASVGGHLARFEGADVLGPDGAGLRFALHGKLPVARASGKGVARSAAGRLAAETVAWAPQALTPQAGARWRPVDDDRAAVTLEAAGETVEVVVKVGADGELAELALQRWNDSAKPQGLAPFGGSVSEVLVTSGGVQVAGRGRVGWEWGTPEQAEGEFFSYRVMEAIHRA